MLSDTFKKTKILSNLVATSLVTVASIESSSTSALNLIKILERLQIASASNG